jgi:GNAT superfamily N-acetyltransferase
MMDAVITIVPASEATRDDLAAIFGTSGDPATCQCQWFKIAKPDWRGVPRDEPQRRLNAQTRCGHPGSSETSGIVAYLDGEPVGWCAIESRSDYVRLQQMRIPWAGRAEDKDDGTVFAVTCFVVRKGFRKRGVSRALAAATVDFARERGARAAPGYPMTIEPGKEVMWGQLFVGSVGIFEEAGYSVVSSPTPRRRVMRIDF